MRLGWMGVALAAGCGQKSDVDLIDIEVNTFGDQPAFEWDYGPVHQITVKSGEGLECTKDGLLEGMFLSQMWLVTMDPIIPSHALAEIDPPFESPVTYGEDLEGNEAGVAPVLLDAGLTYAIELLIWGLDEAGEGTPAALGCATFER